jgi:hypothetical protein
VSRETHFQLNTCRYNPCIASFLTRGWVCRLQLMLALASAVILGSESRGTHDHILLSQTRDSTNPTNRAFKMEETDIWNMEEEVADSSETSVTSYEIKRCHNRQYHKLKTGRSRAIAQAVSRWLPTAVWWRKWVWGRFSPSTSVSPANLHSTKFSIIIITRGRYNRPFSGRRAEWTQCGLQPPLCELKKKKRQEDFMSIAFGE